MTKIYLDNCVLNRPFDDQSQERIRLETEAIVLLLSRELGLVGMIRFMQQFEMGQGDYSKDRHQWLDKYTVDDIVKVIRDKKTKYKVSKRRK